MKLGVDIQFATTWRTGLFFQHLHLFRELRQRCWDITLFLDGWANRGSAGAQCAKRIQEDFMGLPVKRVKVPGRLRRLRMALSPLGWVDVFYHVLHGQFGPLPTAANAYLVSDLIPLVFDYPVPGYRSDAEAYYDAAMQHGDVVLVYSEHTKSEIVQRYGAEAGRIVVMPLAAGPEFRPATDRASINTYLRSIGVGDAPYVLSVGTLEERKNLAVLVRAFARLKRADPSLPHRLVLCGAKSFAYENLLQAAAQEQVAGDVLFLGYGQKLELLYGGASLFVFPSLYEGFGLPPLEAMACGTPVIASNATSIPEVAGDAAILVDPNDDATMAQAMARVLEDRSLHQSLAAAGLKRAAGYSWKTTADRFTTGLELARASRTISAPFSMRTDTMMEDAVV